MRILGGHPSLDLANTLDSRHGRVGPDLVATYADLVEWAERVHLLSPEAGGTLRVRAGDAPADAEAALAQTKCLREAIYRVFSAAAAGREATHADLALIEGMARRAHQRRRLVATGSSYAWAWSDDDLHSMATRLAHEAAELLTSSRLGRVKECFGPNCGWLFLDTSRNGLRRWCSEESCGTRTRVARHRAKTPNP